MTLRPMIHWQYYCAKSLAQSDCCKFIASVSCYIAQVLSCCNPLQQLELALFPAIWLQQSCDLIGCFIVNTLKFLFTLCWHTIYSTYSALIGHNIRRIPLKCSLVNLGVGLRGSGNYLSSV